MCPAAMWIVVGWEIRRSQVETALAFGVAAFPRQSSRRPAGTNPASGPYLRESSKSASVREQRRPRSPLMQASSTGPGSSIVRSGSSFAEAGDVVRVTCRHDVGKRRRGEHGITKTPRYVLWGEGTTDEMCLGILQVTRG